MASDTTPEGSAIVLGVAAYVALVGWLMILPLIGFVLLMLVGAQPPFEGISAGSITHQLLGIGAFVASGYVTGRASTHAPVFNAAVLGVVLYVLVTLFDRALWAIFDVSEPLDVGHETLGFVRAVIATALGGTAALWHARTRGATQLRFGDFSRHTRFVLLALAIGPFAFLAASYRP